MRRRENVRPTRRVGLLPSVVIACLTALTGSASAEEFDCVIDPAVVVNIGSQVPGLVQSVLVSRGDQVAAGDVIAKLASNVEAATVALLSEQAASNSEIEAQQARADLAAKKLQRIEELVRRNFAPNGELDQAAAEMEVVTRELAIAKMRKRSAELELSRAYEILEQKTIRSPIDGIVVERTLSAGEFLDQEGKVATVAQLDPLFVEVVLPVSNFGSVKIGDRARVEPNEPIEGAYYGTVTVIDRVFNAASGTFGLRVELPNPDQLLPVGHRCRVTFDAIQD